jgi:hypothetical protein
MRGKNVLIMVIVITVIIITIISIIILSKKKKGMIPSPTRQGNEKFKMVCLPNPSPMDAQFGSVLYIAGNSPVENAKRRFLLYNSSKFTMKVISFAFGGYDRRYNPQNGVTELIDEKLMEQYGYSNVVLPGGVFSLDPMNDKHVMYKGWYNSPIWIAYTLQNPSLAADIVNGYASQPSVSSLKYQVLGWYQMRLQDELSSYTDSNGDKSQMIRNGCIHWKTGDNIGDARPLDLLGSDGQCKYYTELYTFEPVNVKSVICDLGIIFPNTVYLNDPVNLATCLRNIAMSGSALAMNSTIDIDNFMNKNELVSTIKNWIDNIDPGISAILWIYTQIGKFMTNNGLVSLLKNSVGYTKISNVPNDQLSIIVDQFISGNTAETISQKFLSFIGPFVDVLAHYIMENASTIILYVKNLIIETIISTIRKLGVFSEDDLIALGEFLNSIPLDKIKKIIIDKIISEIPIHLSKFNDTFSSGKFMNNFSNISSQKIGEFITAQIEIVKAKFNIILPALGISEISHGKSGKDKYAKSRKGWINSELKKGKLGLDARCSGLWQIEYY